MQIIRPFREKVIRMKTRKDIWAWWDTYPNGGYVFEQIEYNLDWSLDTLPATKTVKLDWKGRWRVLLTGAVDITVNPIKFTNDLRGDKNRK